VLARGKSIDRVDFSDRLEFGIESLERDWTVIEFQGRDVVCPVMWPAEEVQLVSNQFLRICIFDQQTVDVAEIGRLLGPQNQLPCLRPQGDTSKAPAVMDQGTLNDPVEVL
jgi:hypothetical protein